MFSAGRLLSTRMDERFKKKFPYYLLLTLLIIYFILAFLSEGSIGGADDIAHFKFSRYAFKNPEFFLDPWGKPLFTMLMAPFAQFGMMGVRVFNIVLGLAAGLLTYLTARKLEYEFPVLAIFLLVFAPLYAVLMISGMTEILFSFVLILGIYLFFSKHERWSAVVISMLPFVRTEGAVIFPLFMLAFAINRRWLAIPFLFSGFLFFSLLGSFHCDDLFWVINTMPYSGGARDIYGSGELLYYVKKFWPIFGPFFFAMIVVGMLYIPVHLFTGRKKTRIDRWNEVIVGFLPFLVYFTAHSYVWWKGSGNSVGEIRVMAAVFPSTVLLAMLAWSVLLRRLTFGTRLPFWMTVTLSVLLVLTAFRIHKMPVDLSPPQQLLKKAAGWLEETDYTNNKIYYFDPYLWYFLDMDPTDRDKIQQFIPDVQYPEKNIKPGEIVLWDAHYGPNEGRLPLDRLLDNPAFGLIRKFRPDFPFQVLGGNNYEIYVFRRIKAELSLPPPLILEQLFGHLDSSDHFRVLEFHDYESERHGSTGFPIKNEIVPSGSSSCYIGEDIEFVDGLKIPVGEVKATEGSRIMISLFHYFVSLQEEAPTLMVLSLNHKEEISSYHTWVFQTEQMQKWETSTFEITIPDWESPDDILSVYIWNRGRNKFFIDGFAIGLRKSP